MTVVNGLQHIVSAAEQVFKRKGLRAARVEDVATELGIQKGSLYHHVPAKSSLVVLAVVPLLERLVANIRRIRTTPDHCEMLEEAIVDLATNIYGHAYLFNQRSLWADPASEATSFNLVHQAYLTYVDELAGLLADFRGSRTRNGSREPDMTLAAHGVIGMVTRLDSGSIHDDCMASVTAVVTLIKTGLSLSHPPPVLSPDVP
jgi:AcrR family transcriptional regulator